MCTQLQLENISKQIYADYKRIYGDALQEVFLYGSYARGDYDDESDIDYTAIVKGDRLTLQRKLKQLWAFSADLGIEHDVVVSPTVIPADEFDRYGETLPYYRSIKTEGIRIG